MRIQDVPQILFLTIATYLAALAMVAADSNPVTTWEVTAFFGGMVAGGITLLVTVLNLKR